MLENVKRERSSAYSRATPAGYTGIDRKNHSELIEALQIKITIIGVVVILVF